MESEQYQACVDLLSELLERQDRQSVDSPNSVQARSKHSSALPCQLAQPAAKAARAKPDGETACQKSFLQVARGNALFKLSRYQQALSDFDAALHGSLCGVSPELQRRMRICRQAVKRQRRKGKAKVSDARFSQSMHMHVKLRPRHLAEDVIVDSTSVLCLPSFAIRWSAPQ